MIVEKLHSKNSMYFSVFLQILLNFDICYFLLCFKQTYFKEKKMYLSAIKVYIFTEFCL